MKPWYLLDCFMKCVAVLDPTLPEGLHYEEDLLVEKLSFSETSFEFKVPINHPDARKMTTSCYILIPSSTKHADFFSVLEIEEEERSGYIQVWCEPYFISELGSRILRPVALRSVTMEQAMNVVLNGSGWILGENEGSGVRDFPFAEPITVLEAIHQISHSFNMELHFQIEMKGFQIKQRRVHACAQRGKLIRRPILLDDQKRVLKKEIDRKGMVTALIGIGPQKEDGSFLTFRDYVPSATKGLEKEEDWVGDPALKERWGSGKHLFGIYRDEYAQNKVELYQNTVRELRKRAKSRMTYTLELSTIDDIDEEVMIGDIFYIHSAMESNPIKMRVIERTKSRTNPKENSITAEKI